MGLISAILLAPLIPVTAPVCYPLRGVMSLGEVIQRQVDQDLHDPARTRRQLEELEDRRQRGEISAEEERQAQEEIMATRIVGKPPLQSPRKGRRQSESPRASTAAAGNPRRRSRRKKPQRG
jgi:hypothetical protein